MLPLSTFLLNKAPFSLKLQVTGHTDAGLLMLLLQGRPGEYPARGQAASSSTNTAERHGLYLETGGRVRRAYHTPRRRTSTPLPALAYVNLKALLPSMRPRGLRPRNNI